MKNPTGKIRKPRKAPQTAPLPPLDPLQRHTVKETTAYLRTSAPTVYKLIKAGLLESFKEGRRTFITGRSIAARSLPPGKTLEWSSKSKSIL
jgi:excisionase family DNA binding protein